MPAEPEPEVREVRRMSESAPVERATNEGSVGTGPDRNVVEEKKGDDVTLDPQEIKGVEQFLGGFTIRLGNGLQIDTTEVNDASELEKFVGTKHKVVFTVTKTDGTLQLKSFALAR